MKLKAIALSLVLAATVNVQKSQAFPYNDLESVVAWKSMTKYEKTTSLMCQKFLKVVLKNDKYIPTDADYFMACVNREAVNSVMFTMHKKLGTRTAHKLYDEAEKAVANIDKKVAKIKMDLEPCGTARSGFASCD